jgi:K+-sensing histidine kinase KdpD
MDKKTAHFYQQINNLLPEYFEQKEEVVSNFFNSKLGQHCDSKNLSQSVGVCGATLGIIRNWKNFSEAQRQKYAISTAENADILLNLVNNILGFAELNCHNDNIRMESLDLKPIIENILEERELICSAKNQECTFEKDFDCKAVAQCNKHYVSQLLSNLVYEAIGCMGCKQIKVSLKKLSMPQKAIRRSTNPKIVEVIKFSIESHGSNIIKKEISRIFDLFSRMSKTIQVGDLWEVSLALSKKIIDLHRGKIWTENTEDQGMRFCFVLPVMDNKR